MSRCAGLAVVFLVLDLGPITAQELRGRVSDVSTDEPLAQTLLTVLDRDSALVGMAVSNVDGNFLLRYPQRDSVRVHVERLGYAPTYSVPLSLAQGDTLRLEIRLRPRPIELDTITAAAESRLDWNLVQFLRRKENGFGRYAGPEEIAELRFNSAVELIMRVDGGRFVPIGANDRMIVARVPPGSINAAQRPAREVGGYCTPRVYVDGTLIQETVDPPRGLPLPPAVPVDWYVAPSEIRGIEVYKNPNEAPGQFQVGFGGGCPVVAIWTDWGLKLGRYRPQ